MKKINLPPSQITCLENLLGATLLWTIPLCWPFLRGQSALNHSTWGPLHRLFSSLDSPWRKPLYWVRAILALVSSWVWVVSIQKLPLVQSVAMGFLSPFVTLMGAWFFLNETLTLRRMLAIVLAFSAGTMIAIGSQKNLVNAVFDPWILGPLVATVLFSITSLMSKSLLSVTSPLVLTRSLMTFTGLSLLTTYSQWGMLSRSQMGMLLFLAVVAASAHICAHLAMARSDIIALWPLGVIRFILTGLLGWAFLGEIPSFWLVCGMLLGIAASFSLSWRFKK